MHEAAAAVAGGTLQAMEAILAGQVAHAFHPGGGLHHALADRASGFCIYNDPALAIARARAAGWRVLYVDLDVHHGDGVQALHWHDPGVLTFSIHESGRYLFPGTGFVSELGGGRAAGTAVNVPLEPLVGDDVWWEAVVSLLPLLAAAFGPDVVVSQHGADGHLLDPLAHLSLTTAAMGSAARLVDGIAHRWAKGRWLATGGGGYDVYRVVPRAWALVWLAQAHLDPPERLPQAWRQRWSDEAARFAATPLPETLIDRPEDGAILSGGLRPGGSLEAVARSRETIALVLQVAVPAFLRAARERRWWDPLETGRAALAAGPDAGSLAGSEEPQVVELDREALDRLAVAPRVLPVADPDAARTILRRAAADGGLVVAARSGHHLVGVALAVPRRGEPVADLLALGVAPPWRRRGLGRTLARRMGEAVAGRGLALEALVTVAERDWVDPDPPEIRRQLARRLLEAAGCRIVTPPPSLASIDPVAVAGRRRREPGGQP
jgi:acetoin utilization deacetylase AcuC-like enzyme/ribosomal protein S18 acetylase RimI-like enzyme